MVVNALIECSRRFRLTEIIAKVRESTMILWRQYDVNIIFFRKHNNVFWNV